MRVYVLQQREYTAVILGWEIYKAFPWLGPAQFPMETDEFVAMAGVA